MTPNKKGYVIRRYLGGDGLGAKMGNYAILYSIHLMTGLTPAYLKDEDNFAFNFFNKDKKNPLLPEDTFPKLKTVFEGVNFAENQWGHINVGALPAVSISQIILQNRDKVQNFSFEWFQHYKSWYSFRKPVFDLFTFDDSLIEKSKLNLPQDNKEIVGVSLRHEYRKIDSGHSKLGLDYYRKAFSFFPKDAVFLIFADFIEESPSFLAPIAKEYDIRYTSPLSSAEGMCALSMCDHVINANSSFSFWASMLNKNPNKKIVAPNYFLEQSNPAASILNHDWFPNDWIGLDEV
jgi:hypothetical protein